MKHVDTYDVFGMKCYFDSAHLYDGQLFSNEDGSYMYFSYEGENEKITSIGKDGLMPKLFRSYFTITEA